MSTVQIDIELVTESFKTALQSATNQTKSFSQVASQSFASVKNSFTVMAGNLAAAGVQTALAAITNALSSVIDEAAQSEQAIQNLNIALKQAGLYSQKASDDLQEFAGQLQAVTIYSDEAVMSSLSLFASLTNLDKEGIKKATRAAADLAATLNIDLASATDMVAKSINGNTIGFSKIGISIQKADTDAQRLENTLAALATQQGAAEAASNTYAGAQAKSKNQLSELLEAIGKLITENPAVIAGINAMSNAFAASAQWITENKENINGFFVQLGTAMKNTLFPFVQVIQLVASSWNEITIATYEAIAATIEYAAKAVGLVSDEQAKNLNEEAQAWRNKAQAVKDSIAAEEQAKIDQVNSLAAKQAEIESQQEQQRQKKLAAEAADVARINNNKLETARIQGQNLNLIEQERLLQEQEILTQAEQAKAETVAGYDASKLEQTLAAQQEQLLARQEYERQLLQVQIDAELNKAKLEADAEARKKAVDAANDKAALDRAKLNSKQQIDILKARVKSEELTNKQREDGQRSTLDTIATLQSSSNKELATIGKAAAISTATIDGYVAVQKALATVPYPFNFAAAALVGVATAANVAKIAGVNFADGGIVGGSSNTGDRIRANLNSGEMVLNRNQQATLFKIANSGVASTPTDNTQTNNLLKAILNAVQSSTSIQVDGREIISVVRDGISSGRSIA